MSMPRFDIDHAAFHADPYPILAEMRETTPIAYVPQLDAVLLTRRQDVSTCEKNIAVFSSVQPEGLLSQIMGETFMRKDGPPHMAERKMAFPAFSGRTIRAHWTEKFRTETAGVIAGLATQTHCDLVRDFALPVAAHGLRHVTGLTNLTPAEMDTASQQMLDAAANYAGDPDITAKGHAAATMTGTAIAERQSQMPPDDPSLIGALTAGGMSLAGIQGNIRVVIGGGQNEPRDAIAGTAWALLTHPDALQDIRTGHATWLQAFEEYTRWIAPIGMTPRRIAQDHTYGGVTFATDQRALLMFSSANRDEAVFDAPDTFDIHRDTAPSVAFGAGPHFCAGAGVSRVLIADIALPMLFDAFPNMALDGNVTCAGWAFRGPLTVPVRLHG